MEPKQLVRLNAAEQAFYNAGFNFGVSQAYRAAADQLRKLLGTVVGQAVGAAEENPELKEQLASTEQWAGALRPLATTWEDGAASQADRGQREIDRALELRHKPPGLPDRVRGAILGAVRGFREPKG